MRKEDKIFAEIAKLVASEDFDRVESLTIKKVGGGSLDIDLETSEEDCDVTVEEIISAEGERLSDEAWIAAILMTSFAGTLKDFYSDINAMIRDDERWIERFNELFAKTQQLNNDDFILTVSKK